MRGGAGHSAPLRAAPIRRAAESAWSKVFLVGVRLFVFVSESAWSPPFQAESAVRGRSQASLTGVRLESAVSGRSQAGVSRSRPESALSQLLLARGTPHTTPPPHNSTRGGNGPGHLIPMTKTSHPLGDHHPPYLYYTGR